MKEKSKTKIKIIRKGCDTKVKCVTTLFRKGENMSKKKIKRQANFEDKQPTFSLKRTSPLTKNQEYTFNAYNSGYNLVLNGMAGTGKTFVSLYLALNEVLNRKTDLEKIIIIRSVVPSRDMGFLPGNIKEKIKVYEEPYREICNELLGRGSAYDLLKTKGLVEFTTTSYLRGITFNNAIVIVDEMQNCVLSELDTTITRLGDNSRIVFCGDYRQTDLDKAREKSGLFTFLNILKRIDSFRYVEFEKEDIIRSGIVRDYIISRTEMGIMV